MYYMLIRTYCGYKTIVYRSRKKDENALLSNQIYFFHKISQ